MKLITAGITAMVVASTALATPNDAMTNERAQFSTSSQSAMKACLARQASESENNLKKAEQVALDKLFEMG